MRKNNKSITLVEILVVLTIVGIMMGIFAINYGRMARNRRLSNASRIILTTANTARSMSVTQRQIYSLAIDTATEEVWVCHGVDTTNIFDHKQKLPMTAVIKDVYDSSGEYIASGSSGYLSFNPLGQALDNSGNIDTFYIHIESSGSDISDKLTVKIHSATGKAQIVEGEVN